MNDCLAFLDTHTDECIIMSVKNEGDIPIANPFATEIEDVKARWYLNTDIPKLQEARGKIVLLRRFASDSRMEIPALPWEDNCSFLTDNDRIYVQDHYKVYDTKESITGKWEQILATLTDAQNPESSLMFINFSSGAEGITPKMLATGEAILSDLDGINDRLYNYITNIEHARLGIIVMDFPEFPDELFIPYIISTNKCFSIKNLCVLMHCISLFTTEFCIVKLKMDSTIIPGAFSMYQSAGVPPYLPSV